MKAKHPASKRPYREPTRVYVLSHGGVKTHRHGKDIASVQLGRGRGVVAIYPPGQQPKPMTITQENPWMGERRVTRAKPGELTVEIPNA